jgi:hypothetical protein
MLQFLPFLIYCLVKSVNFLLLELAFQFLFLVLGVDLGGSHLEMIDETPHQCYKRKRLYENSKRRKERRQTLAGKLAGGKARGHTMPANPKTPGGFGGAGAGAGAAGAPPAASSGRGTMMLFGQR